MQPSETIRNAVAQVSHLRDEQAVRPALALAVSAVKSFQSRRFAGTYSDLLAGHRYQMAVRFFLGELYGDADYAQRDAQFSRVSGALQRLLPRSAVATAVKLAELHAMSERLDHAMGQAWLISSIPSDSDQTTRYIRSWRAVSCRADRVIQLGIVLDIGFDLARLTGTPGLRTMLKMMRGPARGAGLGELQRFLEAGFDTFAAIGKKEPGPRGFLDIIQERESRLIALLFDANFSHCRSEINREMESRESHSHGDIEVD